MTTRYQVFKINEDGTEEPGFRSYRSRPTAETMRDSEERLARYEHGRDKAKGWVTQLPRFEVREVQGE